MSGRKRTFEKVAQDIDIRLGDVLGHLGTALEEAVSRLGEAQGGGEIRRERRFDTESGPVRASAGIRIRTLGGAVEARSDAGRAPDKPINPQRNPAQSTSESPGQTSPEIRYVEATIFQDSGVWMLVADMPGIAQEDVTWTREGAHLRLEGRNAARHFKVDTDWPNTAQEGDLVCRVVNGIVELRAKGAPA